ncbi:MAG TPA: geranylgeranylglyceryl/heptaprenylglyceryl phosphate synthase [Bacteroidales bacterium]|nr:geranylgeranylglyceryl/heptaprenylglyceryl phosphate synthase [Bacteroidales bacterium]
MQLYHTFQQDAQSGKKQFAILIDPDKNSPDQISRIAQIASREGVDYFFMGGSLLMQNHLEKYISCIRKECDIPVILFPGNNIQLTPNADAILLLSLISGRNPDLLIGRHVISAPFLKQSRLEILPTGYLLIDGGNHSSVAYMSNTTPIPALKNDIAAATAMAGEMLGLKLIYLDAGSGASHPVLPAMIHAVKSHIAVPLIVGGGINTPDQALLAFQAGADVIVVGNALEKDPDLIPPIARQRKIAGRKG